MFTSKKDYFCTILKTIVNIKFKVFLNIKDIKVLNLNYF